MQAGKQRKPSRGDFDIHLANGQPDMISNPATLTQFIAQLPHVFPVDPAAREQLELIIAGDFIDYLNIQEYAAWTPDPAVAVPKLADVTDRSQFAPVFDALAEHVGRGHRLTILLGNHDVELACRRCRRRSFRGCRPRHTTSTVHVMDGRAYRLGRALIEHGNRWVTMPMLMTGPGCEALSLRYRVGNIPRSDWRSLPAVNW